MAYDFNGTNQWLNSGSPPATAAPLTLSCLFNLDSLSGSHTLISLCNTGATNHYFALTALGSSTDDPLAARSGDSSVATGLSPAPGYQLTTWHHGAAVFASSTSRIAYIDGRGGTENTSDRTPVGINDISIGRLSNSSPTAEVNGRIAEVAIWTAALTALEIAALARGESPSRVRPASLVFHDSLVRTIGDRVGGLILTNNNAATVDVHPRIIRPRPRTYFIPAAAPGGTAVPVFHHHYQSMRTA